jgi:hypothetical protein
MADYKEIWTAPDDPTVKGYFNNLAAAVIPLDPANKDYQDFLAWQAEGGIADPAYTTAEIDAAALAGRQAARIGNLKEALIYQFKMILALFQVGKDKGIWINTDFDADLRAKAAEWIQLINDYENEV